METSNAVWIVLFDVAAPGLAETTGLLRRCGLVAAAHEHGSTVDARPGSA
jgi:hypothetical protein